MNTSATVNELHGLFTPAGLLLHRMCTSLNHEQVAVSGFRHHLQTILGTKEEQELTAKLGKEAGFCRCLPAAMLRPRSQVGKNQLLKSHPRCPLASTEILPQILPLHEHLYIRA